MMDRREWLTRVGFGAVGLTVLPRLLEGSKAIAAPIAIKVYKSPSFALAGCEKKTVDYMDLVVGGAGIDALLETKRAAYGEAPGRLIKGVLREQNGGPLAGAYIHAQSNGS